jgi:dephospho-CoA kinase
MLGFLVAARTLRRTLARMILIGLTGNIASGKTEVADLLEAKGATIVDADELAREAVAPGTQALDRIRERWGDAILAADGTLRREELRQRVFADAEQLEALNAIVHPEIARLRDERISAARAEGVKVLVYVAPLLFERHLADEFDKIVLVDAPRELRFDRLVRVRGVDEAEAMNMIAAQMPAELKRARADYIIDNVGSLDDLRAGVERVWGDLQREASRELAPL